MDSEQNQLMELKNSTAEIQDDNSNGSSKSEEGLNEEEINYLKNLTEDRNQMIALVQRAASLEIRNSNLLEEKRTTELSKFELEGRFEGEIMLFKSKVSTLEGEMKKLIREEMELKKEISRLETNKGCITHIEQMKSDEETIRSMKTEIGYLKTEVIKLREENEQLRTADKQSKKEGTFLDEESTTVIAIKGKIQPKNDIKDDISVSSAGSGKGKTGRSIKTEEINELRETLKNHGPVKFFEELENVFQLHEVKTLSNKVRLIKMKILSHCEYVNLIENNMNLEQIQAIVAKNDDSASRYFYYKELVLGAARKITAKGAGILNYISVFEANYKQLHTGLSAHALVDEFIFFIPGDIKELLRNKVEEERSKSGNEDVTLSNWITATKEYATNKERVISEDLTRIRTLEINNNNALANAINNVKNNGKFNNTKNNFRVEGSTSNDQTWFEMNKGKIMKLLQEVKVPTVVENNTNVTTTTTTSNPTPSSVKIAGKCFNCNKVGHRAVDCRSKPKPASTNTN
ncbi:hypothetical protein ACTFIZ_008079 [Dictyostelium cf. discoideum]